MAASGILIMSTLGIFSSFGTSVAARAQQNFYRVWADYGVEPIGESSKCQSASACAVRTTVMYPASGSFMFSPFLGMCLPGGRLGRAFGPPNDAVGDLYVDLKPPPNLVVVSQDGATACVGIFEELLTYADAAQRCEGMGYFLASVRNLPKLDVLVQLAGDRSLWVGCEGGAEVGSLVWREDRSEVSADTLASVFSVDEPKNDLTEHCCLYRNDTQKLHDYDCAVLYPFVCEVALLNCTFDLPSVT